MPELWPSRGAAAAHGTIVLTEPLVLLADARVEARETIAFHLAMAGFPVVQAGSVDAVVDELHRGRPDVVVVSDELGDRPVGDLLALINDQPDGDGVPVITLSDDPSSRRLVECLTHGARDHVRRQAGADELIARIDAVLRADDELERLRRRNAELQFLAAVDLPLSAVMARADDAPPAGLGRARADRHDAVLRELGYLVTAARRADDFAGVWDARTFALLLPVTPIEGARVFAERLRSVVGAAPVRYGDTPVPVTLSCAYAEVGVDPAAVLPALEAAVDAAEAGGGNAIGRA
jgi:PleD family two-component response regulator